MSVEICEINYIHEEQVKRAKSKMEKVDVKTISGQFKLLGDENRFKIIHALTFEKELCVCDIASIIGATTATTSHHLQALKKIGVVDSVKKGKLVYYFSSDNQITELIQYGENLKQVIEK